VLAGQGRVLRLDVRAQEEGLDDEVQVALERQELLLGLELQIATAGRLGVQVHFDVVCADCGREETGVVVEVCGLEFTLGLPDLHPLGGMRRDHGRLVEPVDHVRHVGSRHILIIAHVHAVVGRAQPSL